MNNYTNPFAHQSPGTFAKSGDSTANAAVTVTQAAVAGFIHYITDIEVYIKGAAAGNDITIDLKDGATIIYGAVIGNGAATGAVLKKELQKPIKITRGNAVSLVVSAGGAAVISRANLIGYTDRQ